MADYYGLSALGVCCALGEDCRSVWRGASKGDTSALVMTDAQLPGGLRVPFGACAVETGDYPSRVAALMVAAVKEINIVFPSLTKDEILRAIACFASSLSISSRWAGKFPLDA